MREIYSSHQRNYKKNHAGTSKWELPMTAKNIRLYVQQSLTPQVTLDKDQSHYLVSVMRVKSCDQVRVFNSADGEFMATVSDAHKKACVLDIQQQLRKPEPEPQLHLYFSPIKSHRLTYLIEKAVEVGATHLHPVICQHTQFPKLNLDKISKQVIEAVEQCGRLHVPQVTEPQPLATTLESLTHPLIVCDERRNAKSILDLDLPAAFTCRFDRV